MSSFLYDIEKDIEKRIKIKFFTKWFYVRSLKFINKIDPV